MYEFWKWVNWRSFRSHLCSLAVAVSFVNTWRLPRDAFRYGGISTAILFTLAMVTVCLSTALLQLAIGQLSQQDVVGVWRAVPFFTGVGYLRLLASFVYSICTIIYVALCVTYFFFSLSNSVSFWECPESSEILVNNTEYIQNTSTCVKESLLAPVNEEPEFYVATSLIVIVLWVLFPFIFYKPVKLMKRMFYMLGPIVILLGCIIVIGIGEKDDLSFINKSKDWTNLGKSMMWHGAIAQALLSAQVAGGFLIAAGDTIYANTDVEWTALSFVGANILTSWIALIFWYSISGDAGKDESNLAVLVQTLILSIDKKLNIVWPLLIFAMLFCSGTTAMLTLLYPIYETIRRVGGPKWRYYTVGVSLLAAAATLSVVAIGHSVLELLEEIIVPFLVTISTSLEISAFVFIYGWKVLVEDVEFLIERKLSKYWILGMCAAPGIIIPITIWWIVNWFYEETDWTRPPWIVGGLFASISMSLVIFTIFAIMSIVKQVQYDVLSKLKSSFKPSRHWGPRDPITHYYWLTRRDESVNVRTTYRQRRQLGQRAITSSILQTTDYIESEQRVDKKRANSDDILFLQRKEHILEMNKIEIGYRGRSKSFDWAMILRNKFKSK